MNKVSGTLSSKMGPSAKSRLRSHVSSTQKRPDWSVWEGWTHALFFFNSERTSSVAEEGKGVSSVELDSTALGTVVTDVDDDSDDALAGSFSSSEGACEPMEGRAAAVAQHHVKSMNMTTQFSRRRQSYANSLKEFCSHRYRLFRK